MTKERKSENPLVVQLSKGRYSLPVSDRVRVEFDNWASSGSGDYDSDVAHCPAYSRFFSLLSSELEKREKAGRVFREMLDIGCGTGLAGLPFLAKGIEVDGTDISEKMMVKAKARGYRHLFQRDLANQDLNLNHVYDLIISLGVIGDYVTLEQALPRIIPVCSPNAIFAFTSSKTATLKNRLRGSLKSSGFEINSLTLNPAFEGENIREEKAFYVISTRA